MGLEVAFGFGCVSRYVGVGKLQVIRISDVPCNCKCMCFRNFFVGLCDCGTPH